MVTRVKQYSLAHVLLCLHNVPYPPAPSGYGKPYGGVSTSYSYPLPDTSRPSSQVGTST